MRGGKKSYFAKVNDAERKALFAAEAEGLAAIEKAGSVRVPRVIAQGDDEPLAELADSQGEKLGPSGGRRGLATGTFFHVIAKPT